MERTTSVNNGFIIWFTGSFSFQDAAGKTLERGKILVTRVANHSAGFDSFCQLAKLAIL